MTVVPLYDGIVTPGQPNEAIVTLLRGMLAMAESGEMTGVAVAFVTAISFGGSSEAGNGHKLSLVGSLQLLKRRFENEIQETMNNNA